MNWHIHNIEINIYSLEGALLKSSKEFFVDKVSPSSKNTLKLVRSSIENDTLTLKR
jgi:hypothetical protein